MNWLKLCSNIHYSNEDKNLSDEDILIINNFIWNNISEDEKEFFLRYDQIYKKFGNRTFIEYCLETGLLDDKIFNVIFNSKNSKWIWSLIQNRFLQKGMEKDFFVKLLNFYINEFSKGNKSTNLGELVKLFSYIPDYYDENLMEEISNLDLGPNDFVLLKAVFESSIVDPKYLDKIIRKNQFFVRQLFWINSKILLPSTLDYIYSIGLEYWKNSINRNTDIILSLSSFKNLDDKTIKRLYELARNNSMVELKRNLSSRDDLPKDIAQDMVDTMVKDPYWLEKYKYVLANDLVDLSGIIKKILHGKSEIYKTYSGIILQNPSLSKEKKRKIIASLNWDSIDSLDINKLLTDKSDVWMQLQAVQGTMHSYFYGQKFFQDLMHKSISNVSKYYDAAKDDDSLTVVKNRIIDVRIKQIINRYKSIRNY